MKWLFFAPLLFAVSLFSQNTTPNALAKRVDALEKKVFGAEKCGSQTVRMAFKPEVSDFQVSPDLKSAFCTPDVIVKFPLFKTKTIIVYPPISKDGTVLAFKLKIGRVYQQNTFTSPVYIVFTGRKFTLYE
jgi:hypothetical protein